MLQELDKWLEEVAEQCHQFAQEIDLDFYCFQSALPTTNPDTIIVGINPGGNKKYSKALEELSDYFGEKITKRTKSLLSMGFNHYSVLHPCSSNKKMVIKLSRVFNNDFLQNTLEHSTIFNIYYFNTKDVSLLYSNLNKDVKQYCIKKSQELIDILNPKHIIFLCSEDKELVSMGVQEIRGIGNYVKTGMLNGRKIIALPNPGYYKAYSYKNGVKMGEHLHTYLSE